MGFLANTAYRLLASEPALALQRMRLPAGAVTVYMYHDIGDDRDDVDAWQVVRRSDFLRQIEAVRRHHDIVSMDDAMASLSAPPSPRPKAVLTFDDGNRGNIEHLQPLVVSEAIPVTLYMATGHIDSGQSYWFDRVVNHLQSDRPLHLDLQAFGLGKHTFNETHGAANWARIQAVLAAIKSQPAAQCDALAQHIAEQIPLSQPPVLCPLKPHEVLELAQTPGITLGAHTEGHEVLTLLDLDAARESIATSVSQIQTWTGITPRHFAYPAGYHNPMLMRMVEEMGFVSATTTIHGHWNHSSSPFAIPRVSVGRYDSLPKFKAIGVRR
ncbi:MAG: polysaccharide deacetylase family protein [Aquabacterium sp.]|nr:polysaccharide deacetylase family protein [Aquabacterium sp.]